MSAVLHVFFLVMFDHAGGPTLCDTPGLHLSLGGQTEMRFCACINFHVAVQAAYAQDKPIFMLLCKLHMHRTKQGAKRTSRQNMKLCACTNSCCCASCLHVQEEAERQADEQAEKLARARRASTRAAQALGVPPPNAPPPPGEAPPLAKEATLAEMREVRGALGGGLWVVCCA